MYAMVTLKKRPLLLMRAKILEMCQKEAFPYEREELAFLHTALERVLGNQKTVQEYRDIFPKEIIHLFPNLVKLERVRKLKDIPEGKSSEWRKAFKLMKKFGKRAKARKPAHEPQTSIPVGEPDEKTPLVYIDSRDLIAKDRSKLLF